MAEEEESKDEPDLGQKLEKLVEEIKEVMERRKERIAEILNTYTHDIFNNTTLQ